MSGKQRANFKKRKKRAPNVSNYTARFSIRRLKEIYVKNGVRIRDTRHRRFHFTGKFILRSSFPKLSFA